VASGFADDRHESCRRRRLDRAVGVRAPREAAQSTKYATTSAVSPRGSPSASQPCLRSAMSSRCTRISPSPSTVTKVPLVLWSLSTKLSWRRTIVQCRRETFWLAITSPQRRRELPPGFVRGDDLPLLRLLDQARGEVHRVAEYVVVALDDGAGVKADAHAELGAVDRRQRVHGGVHLGGRARRRVRRGKE